MNRLVLLVVGAAWAAVLVPPLLRSRLEGRPGSSVTSFRRQLTTLQRSTPGGLAPMRQMARPLAGAPRPGAARTHAAAYGAARRATLVEPSRSPRAHHGQQVVARHQRTTAPARASVRQRRQNVLVMLLIAAGGSGLLMMATSAASVRYVFALSACLLVGYVYLLSQNRRAEAPRAGRDRHWPYAA